MKRKFFIGSVGQPGEGYDDENIIRCIKNQAHIMHQVTRQKGVFDIVNKGDILFLKYKDKLVAYGEVCLREVMDDNEELDGWTYYIRVKKWYFCSETDSSRGVDKYGISDYITDGSQMATIKQVDAQWGIKKMREMVAISKQNNLYKIIDMENRIDYYLSMLKSNYNLVLTGAPGTGKTYLAKQIAAQMILGKEYNEETASDNEKKIMKEQCGFVQFHPSYDYTDFVEGLRPINDKNGNVGFERRNGAFKSFCKDAIKITQSNALKMLEWCKNNFPNQPLKSIGSNKEISFELKDGHIYAIASSGNKYPVNDDRIKLYLQTQEYDPQHETYVPTVGKYILDNYPNDIEKSPYVFIIDEINRGEISKIFGELFFSIDPGYRGTAGRVKTQYQNLIEEDDVFYDGFYVPENVYIIGTMNDIDRSVESMDFAFRRRFAFKEVTAEESQQMLYSEPALSEKVDEIIGRMNALNEAICPNDKNNTDKKGIEGLSSAYHIGASYFLKLANYKKDDGTFDYDKLWDYHLKGLLSEYLRGMPDAEEKLYELRKAFDIKTSDSTQS